MDTEKSSPGPAAGPDQLGSTDSLPPNNNLAKKQPPLDRSIGPFAGMSEQERAAFVSVLRPRDLYDPGSGLYWADMPLSARVRFVSAVNSSVRADELARTWAAAKKNPLGPLVKYAKTAVLPGAGLLLEGYVLFSIGNIKSLFIGAFPACWESFQTCSRGWVQAIEYLEILGIVLGQVLVGFIGDSLGRRVGLIQDAAVMLLGLIMLVASWGATLNGWVIMYGWSLFVYGIGVGGEYPMTATMGMEGAVGSGKVSTLDDRMRRGSHVTGAFLMQGWGQFLNQVVLMALLAVITSGNSGPPYSEKDAQFTFRMSFAFPALGTAWLLYYRIFRQSYGQDRSLMQAKKRGKVTGYDSESLRLTIHHFGFRLLATAGTWFANDVFFYGNKLFQHSFIEVLTPGNKSVMVAWKYNLINIAVSMVGYYMASFFIDHKFYGRKRMMIVGFLLDFVLFIVPAFNYDFFTSPAHIHAFQAMYFLSSFFNQFGPNSVTFLVAAEVFPTPIRASAHGFSAAAGKLGALLAAVLYNYIDTHTKFLVVPWFGLGGAILTYLFLPDTTGLDLKEQERRWAFIRAGREHDYHGIAIHPRHLSLYERLRGVGAGYDEQLDEAQRMQEMYDDWQVWNRQMSGGGEDGDGDEGKLDLDSLPFYDLFSSDSRGSLISEYFARFRETGGSR